MPHRHLYQLADGSSEDKVTIASAGSVLQKLRVDKWLWAARFYKTRSLAVQEIGKGRILVNDQVIKPSREIAIDDIISIRRDDPPLVVRVCALSNIRGPASVARLLYEETAASVAVREQAAEMRRLAPEPAQGISKGRPTKRDRRMMDLARGR
jgi:ribosome-associated heat shock protein Hsp15